MKEEETETWVFEIERDNEVIYSQEFERPVPKKWWQFWK